MATEINPITLQYYVVGFFDLLGQQQHLRNLRSLPDKNNAAALAKTREDLNNTYVAVVAMRTWFEDAFNTYSRKPINVSALTPEQQDVYQQMNSNPIRFRGFSDSMIVFLSLRSAETAKLPTRGIFGIFCAAALTFIGCLGRGHPIRGGIDLGLGFEPSEGEVYGPALSRAVTLESKIANYPRIVVGDELMSYLSATRDQQQSDPFARESKRIAIACMNCIAYDHDGIPFIDFLGPAFRADVGSEVDATYIDKAYHRVIEFSNRYKAEKNSQLAFRYTLLRNYFESRLPLWADLPRASA
jgi:hypothetical protein